MCHSQCGYHGYSSVQWCTSANAHILISFTPTQLCIVSCSHADRSMLQHDCMAKADRDALLLVYLLSELIMSIYVTSNMLMISSPGINNVAMSLYDIIFTDAMV